MEAEEQRFKYLLTFIVYLNDRLLVWYKRLFITRGRGRAQCTILILCKDTFLSKYDTNYRINALKATVETRHSTNDRKCLAYSSSVTACPYLPMILSFYKSVPTGANILNMSLVLDIESILISWSTGKFECTSFWFLFGFLQSIVHVVKSSCNKWQLNFEAIRVIRNNMDEICIQIWFRSVAKFNTLFKYLISILNIQSIQCTQLTVLRKTRRVKMLWKSTFKCIRS